MTVGLILGSLVMMSKSKPEMCECGHCLADHRRFGCDRCECRRFRRARSDYFFRWGISVVKA